VLVTKRAGFYTSRLSLSRHQQTKTPMSFVFRHRLVRLQPFGRLRACLQACVSDSRLLSFQWSVRGRDL